jgi:site-specific DNA recombinase
VGRCRGGGAQGSRARECLIQAIKDGVPASEVKDHLARIAARREELEALLSGTREEPVLLYPSMAHVYRQQIANLRVALMDEDCRAEATEILRELIDSIELAPVCRDGKETLSITLCGDLAGILRLVASKKGPLEASDPSVVQVNLVAGGGFEPPTFRL